MAKDRPDQYEEKEFATEYFFNNMQMVTVTNPLTEDFEFGIQLEVGVDMATGQPRTDNRRYKVKKGSFERFPGPVANLYLDQIWRQIAQEKGDMGLGEFGDFKRRAELYDDLVLEVQDMLNTHVNLPQYDVTNENKQEEPEQAFATLNKDTNENNTPSEGTPKTRGRPPKAITSAPETA